jgi:TPP-dependent pyruvate/acetoin dehydrogenase alpha subunit|tara:strand:+ start:521 stop:1495 length:975 start_codon:yes stop_codon:yes gene_type:complete
MIKKNYLKKIYETQKKIRSVEEKIAINYKQNKMRCPTHLSVGQEAVAASSGLALDHNDIAISYHRSHAHFLAKGGNPKKLFAELHGFDEGCSKGIGGSMHLVDLKNNFYGSTAIVSNSIPVGVGLAYSLKLAKKKNLVCIYIGDAAVEEGVFFESINFSILKKLPVVFICENNFFSVYTHIKNRQPANRKIHKLASAMGAVSHTYKQDNPFKLHEKFDLLFKKIRKNPMTHFVEVETFRYLEHCGPNDDTRMGYRKLKDVEKWKKKDPLIFSKNYLIKNKLYNKKQIDTLDKKINYSIDKDFNFLRGLKKPKFKNISKLVYKSK